MGTSSSPRFPPRLLCAGIWYLWEQCHLVQPGLQKLEKLGLRGFKPEQGNITLFFFLFFFYLAAHSLFLVRFPFPPIPRKEGKGNSARCRVRERGEGDRGLILVTCVCVAEAIGSHAAVML
ncbi:hypothetical protein F4774DRAFT_201651 [Daldinia eschscholtzii]|nr:hypothetical protein F4774DRAFT_201651 [Daldinia eschscholtzii]